MSYYIQVVQTWVLDEYDYYVFNADDEIIAKFENQKDAEAYIKNKFA